MDETDATKKANKTKAKMDYALENSFRHVFHILDFKKEATLNISQLQVICANICRVLDIAFKAEDLEAFNNKSKTLQADGFVTYVRELINKANNAGKNVDLNKLEEICWVIINKMRPSEGRILSSEDTLLLLKAFNKIDIDGELMIHKDEVRIFIEHLMVTTGIEWESELIENYSSNENWTFWNLLECIETKYIHNSPRSIYKEGLDYIEEKYIKEIVKCGILIKKGHKVKSLKERWFVLQPKKLTYYTSKSMKELKGVIIINSSSKVTEMTDSKTGKWSFEITCGETNISYEVSAENRRLQVEWMHDIKMCIEAENSPLYNELLNRSDSRLAKQRLAAEDEMKRQEQNALIKQQTEELASMKLAHEKAEAQAEVEAAMLEEERRRREELEQIKEEYERLLEEEKKAREEEEKVRKLQDQILAEEIQRREDLEKIKAMQEELLEQEKQRREGLEVESKEQARALEEERQRLKELDEQRQKAEDAIAEAHAKLQAAEEERRKAAEAVESAKSRTRNMNIPQGLAKPLQLSVKGFVTHRGAGAFIEDDFKKEPLYMAKQENQEIVNKTLDDGGERAVIVESNLVKPSEKSSFLKDE